MRVLRHPQLLGAFVLTGWTGHAACHLAKGTGLSLLWCCNLGTLFLGLGLLAARPALAGAGLLWVAIGTPAWLIGLALGKLWMPTSLFTHFGALVAGVLAGGAALPEDSWRRACAGLFALHLLSHLVLPQGRDINLVGQTLWGAPAGHLAFAAFGSGALVLLMPVFERGLRAASQRAASSSANLAASPASSQA
jgi:hypothetical protein